jgi:hypothetical protein
MDPLEDEENQAANLQGGEPSVQQHLQMAKSALQLAWA